MRTVILLLSALAVTACSVGPSRPGENAFVVGSSQYCGTSSQDSQAQYFADTDRFSRWLDDRGINEFRSDMAASGGVIVVEMGQRPTGGYRLALDGDESDIESGTLTLAMRWEAPRLDAAVSQALVTPCLAIKPPMGSYRQVRVVDQLGNVRGNARIR